MANLNVRKRNDKWEYRFEGAKIDGKRNQITKGGFKTKKECQEAGNKALFQYMNAGSIINPIDISVHDYLNYWFDTYCTVNLKHNTQIGYLQLIESHLQPNLGMYYLKSLSPSVIQEYANELKLKGYSKSHITGILSTLSGALEYAVEPLGYISVNPSRNIKLPKIEKKKKDIIVLDLDEYKQILDRFKDTRYYIPIMIGFHTGLRISEALALTWQDIDLEKRLINVNKQIVKRSYNLDIRANDKQNTWCFSSTKTVTSTRIVNFGQTLYDALILEYENQIKNEDKYGNFYTIYVEMIDKDEKGNKLIRILPVQKGLKSTKTRVHFVNITESGDYTSAESFKYCTRVARTELKIPFDYHALRHTHATLLLENGANIKDVQVRLGHTNVQTTLNTYVHQTQKMSTQTVDIFENLMKEKNL